MFLRIIGRRDGNPSARFFIGESWNIMSISNDCCVSNTQPFTIHYLLMLFPSPQDLIVLNNKMQKAFRRERSLQAAVISVSTSAHSREPKPFFVSPTLHKVQIGRWLVRFQMMSLEFFIYIILPIALWPWGSTQPLTKMSTRSISWG